MLDLLTEYKTYVYRGLFESFLLLLLSFVLFKYTNIKDIINKNYKKNNLHFFFNFNFCTNS